MKIALAQLNYHIGNFEDNTSKIIQMAQKAAAMGADLIVFAELALSGYPPRDFLEFDDFTRGDRWRGAGARVRGRCHPSIRGRAPVRRHADRKSVV